MKDIAKEIAELSPELREKFEQAAKKCLDQTLRLDEVAEHVDLTLETAEEFSQMIAEHGSTASLSQLAKYVSVQRKCIASGGKGTWEEYDAQLTEERHNEINEADDGSEPSAFIFAMYADGWLYPTGIIC